MVVFDASTPDTWIAVALAALNMIQTVALAWLVAIGRKGNA